jgi:predicted N-formylglutamate amidohydrolase
VEQAILRAEKRGSRVVHIAVHSFTPILNGISRRADVGLLYDPARAGERELCARWQVALEGVDPSLRVRRNYPYRGTSDGFTTALRRIHSAAAYAGIEVELSQRLLRTRAGLDRMGCLLVESLIGLGELELGR